MNRTPINDFGDRHTSQLYYTLFLYLFKLTFFFIFNIKEYLLLKIKVEIIFIRKKINKNSITFF